MKKATMLFSVLFVCLFIMSANGIAGEGHKHGHSSDKSALKGGSAMQTMANIMMNLNHFPSDSEKKALRKIAASGESEHIKTIANAMVNLQHKASSADKAKLKTVMNDTSAPQDVKVLAEIVHNLSHQPSGRDKNKLQAMIN